MRNKKQNKLIEKKYPIGFTIDISPWYPETPSGGRATVVDYKCGSAFNQQQNLIKEVLFRVNGSNQVFSLPDWLLI